MTMHDEAAGRSADRRSRRDRRSVRRHSLRYLGRPAQWRGFVRSGVGGIDHVSPRRRRGDPDQQRAAAFRADPPPAPEARRRAGRFRRRRDLGRRDDRPDRGTDRRSRSPYRARARSKPVRRGGRSCRPRAASRSACEDALRALHRPEGRCDRNARRLPSGAWRHGGPRADDDLRQSGHRHPSRRRPHLLRRSAGAPIRRAWRSGRLCRQAPSRRSIAARWRWRSGRAARRWTGGACSRSATA